MQEQTHRSRDMKKEICKFNIMRIIRGTHVHCYCYEYLTSTLDYLSLLVDVCMSLNQSTNHINMSFWWRCMECCPASLCIRNHKNTLSSHTCGRWTSWPINHTLSCEWTSAWASISTRTTSTCPFKDATISGVPPFCMENDREARVYI